MYCPRCAENQAEQSHTFCTKCGWQIAERAVRNAELENKRRKGIEQGVKLILLSLLMIPIYIFIAPLFPANDVLVESSPSTTWFEQISWAMMWVTCLAGVARIAFALAFESVLNHPVGETPLPLLNQEREFRAALPNGESFQAANTGRWKTTGALFEPVFAKRKTSGEL